MDCQQVQARLSEYLDHTLDNESQEVMESHLSACPACRLEAENLAETVGLLSALPPLDPPADFPTAVMARVRKEAAKPSLWERLFSPLTLKLPIHATALVLIAAFALFLYRETPPPPLENKFADSRQEIPSSPAPAKESLPEVPKKIEQPKSAQVKTKKVEQVGESALEGARRTSQTKDDAAVATAPRAAEKSMAQVEPTTHYELVVRLSTPLERDEPGRKEAFRALRLEREDRSVRSADELKERLQADLSKKQSESQVYWVSVPADQYEALKADLAAWGKIESESRPLSSATRAREEAADPLRIKITILPPPAEPSR